MAGSRQDPSPPRGGGPRAPAHPPADDRALAAEYRNGNADDAGIDLCMGDRAALAPNGLQGGEKLLAGAAEPRIADFSLMLEEQPGEAALREAGQYHLRGGAA